MKDLSDRAETCGLHAREVSANSAKNWLSSIEGFFFMNFRMKKKSAFQQMTWNRG